MSPPVTIAVVSWNTRELLGRCLDSLKADADAGLAEVWVVDNASADGSAEMVRESYGWAHLEASTDNLGFGRAVNLVASRTKSPWIVPANADVEVEPGALRKLLESGERLGRTGIVAPRLIGSAGETQQSVHAFPTVGLAFLLATGILGLPTPLADRYCIDGRWNPRVARRVDWAHGALLLCRREAWDEIGGFDQRQWMYAEDLDIAWQMRAAGWDVRYTPDASVRHAGAASTQQAFGDAKDAKFMAATFAWMADRRGVAITWAYAATNLAGATIRWIGCGLLAGLGIERFAKRRDAARRWMALHRGGLAGRRTLLRSR